MASTSTSQKMPISLFESHHSYSADNGFAESRPRPKSGTILISSSRPGSPPRIASPFRRHSSNVSTPSLIGRQASTSRSVNGEAIIRQDTYKNTTQDEMPALMAHVNVALRASFYRTEEATAPPAICPFCLKVVYSVEELHAVGSVWHKACFVCGGADSYGCSRTLGLDNYTPISGVPYCNACSTRQALSSPNHSYGKVLQKNIQQHQEHSSHSFSREYFGDGNELRRGKERESFIEITANPLYPMAENHELDDYRKDKLLVKPINPHVKKPPTRPIVKNELSAIFENNGKDISEKNNKIFLVENDNKYRSVSAPISPMLRPIYKSVEENHTKEFVKTTSKAEFKYPFDGNGVLYHIGTKAETMPYCNPHLSGTVKLTTDFGQEKSAHFLVEHSLYTNLGECSDPEMYCNWVMLDLGERRSLLPTRYCVKQIRNEIEEQKTQHKMSEKIVTEPYWILRGRENNLQPWTILKVHKKDQNQTANVSNNTVSWLLRPEKNISWAKEYTEKTGFRYFLIMRNGANPLMNDNGFKICGIEFYGLLRETVKE